MASNKGTVTNINDFGLCEIRTNDGSRFAFTLDQLKRPRYTGEPLHAYGLCNGVQVVLETDDAGCVKSVQVAHAAAGT